MLCYLIGYPVEHSMSAVMHNAAFKELGLDYKYELLEVGPGELERIASNTLTDKRVRGANVTIPHKVAVMRYLHEIDRDASRIGAVNTIVNEGGSLKGYNTDGAGALRAIVEAYGSLQDAMVIVVGAGGASRAICYKLAENASKLTILNRTLKHAVALADYLSSLPECRANIDAGGLRDETLGRALGEADVLVNATPLGMYPDAGSSPVDSRLLRSGLLVFDTVYNPLKTRLLLDAEAAGAQALLGVKMLVYQGAAAFELWTGRRAPESTMMGAVIEALGGLEA